MVGPTLPEGEEDDSLDGDELEDRLKWAQQIHGGKVEEEKGIKGQADREVVDDGDVEVSTVDTVGGERERAAALGCGKQSKYNWGQRDQIGKGGCMALLWGRTQPRRGRRAEVAASPLLVGLHFIYFGSQFCPFIVWGQ